MKLEDWVKKDMTRYIKDREPERDDDAPVRQEDYGLLGKVDYELRIKRALKQGRFKEATRQFNELKEKFTAIPEDHQQERKQMYRILQKSYKMIYDWVEDRHKTHRLLDKLDSTADVFDDSVQAHDLDQEASNPEMAPPSIEEQMFRKHNSIPAFDETPDMPDMPAAENPFAKSPEQPQEQISMPQAPAGANDSLPAPQSPAQASAPSPQQPEPQHDTEHGPDWQPPSMQMPRVKRPQPQPTRQEQPQPITQPIPDVHVSDEQARPGFTPPAVSAPKQPTRPVQPDEHTVFRTAANDLLVQARSALQDHDHDTAMTKLIEARFEAQRADDEKTLRAIQALERQLAAKKTVDYKPPRDRELFSTLYLQGVHAMKEGDYKKALELFGKRMSQAPGDHAARIRYNECQEVLDGKAA